MASHQNPVAIEIASTAAWKSSVTRRQPDRRPVRLGMHVGQRLDPGGTPHRADRPAAVEATHRRADREAELADHPAQVEREHLEDHQGMQRRVERQQHLSIPVRVQRVAMVVRVTHPVFVVVPEGQHAQDAQEDAIPDRRAEHRTVPQFVVRRARQEGAHGAEEPEEDAEQQPLPLDEEEGRQRPQGRGQPNVSQRLREALAVAALHQLPERGLLDRAAVPLHPQRLAHLTHRREVGRPRAGEALLRRRRGRRRGWRGGIAARDGHRALLAPGTYPMRRADATWMRARWRRPNPLRPAVDRPDR